MQFTYYQPQSLQHPMSRSFSKAAEVAIGALLLISPMFWLFIAELIK